MKKRKEQLKKTTEEIDTDEQERQRLEMGEEVLEKIKKIIYEKYPDLEGVEPLIRNEALDNLPGNILQRLKQLKTSDKEIDELKKAWKSLLFEKGITQNEVEMIKRIIAVINKQGDLLRIDETI